MSVSFRSLLKQIEYKPSGIDKNDRYVRTLGTLYFLRHISRFFTLGKSELQYISWLAGDRKNELGGKIFKLLNADTQDQWRDELRYCDSDWEDYGDNLYSAIRTIPVVHHRRIWLLFRPILIDALKQLNYRGKSEIEKNVRHAQKMFNLKCHEVDLIMFLFIMSVHEAPEMLFDRKLQSDRFVGRKYLVNILGISPAKTVGTISRLNKIGLVDYSTHSITLDDDVHGLLQNPSSSEISKRYFKRVRTRCVPLNFHFHRPDVIAYLKKLLKRKTVWPTHFLFYGPPGTGKTSMAHALAATANVPIYSIMRHEDNRSQDRRTAITACMNMTCSGKGSIILADEADNLLNTRNSWLFRGETQDKGWLNELMERPNTRVIWITNTTAGIDDAVIRRFAYTLKFKPFNQQQRVILFERIIRANRTKRFFRANDIAHFAKAYRVTAGPFDLAVKKAIDTGAESRIAFQRAVRLSLDAFISFKKDRARVPRQANKDKNYSLEGLNVLDDLDEITSHLERFSAILSSQKKSTEGGMALLFYGPPGTGKTALANHLSDHLRREVIVRRYSDLQSMWIGQGEKNIRDAFLEADREEAILIIDEVDSMLLSRDRAEHSWETSFTNEFLTQMDTFPGILICTTNRLTSLDSAAIRRFTFKIEFDYLTPNGNLIFYHKLIKPLLDSPISEAHTRHIKKIRFLTPGDFKTVRKRYAFHPKNSFSHDKLISQLEKEAIIKKTHKGQRAIGF